MAYIHNEKDPFYHWFWSVVHPELYAESNWHDSWLKHSYAGPYECSQAMKEYYQQLKPIPSGSWYVFVGGDSEGFHKVLPEPGSYEYPPATVDIEGNTYRRVRTKFGQTNVIIYCSKDFFWLDFNTAKLDSSVWDRIREIFSDVKKRKSKILKVERISGLELSS